MPIKLTRLERKFCDLIIKGELPQYKCHQKAGYKTKTDDYARTASSRLISKAHIKEYIELRQSELAEVVKEEQKENVLSTYDAALEIRGRCMEAIEAKDRTGKPLGEYCFDATNAIKANDQIAKLSGDYAPESKSDESHEDWLKRIKRSRHE